MPWLIPIAAVSVLIAIGGVAYACDQETKREEEQERARKKIAKLNKRICELEQKRDHLLPVLGKRNDQVRILADEISRLREKLAKARRRAN